MCSLSGAYLYESGEAVDKVDRVKLKCLRMCDAFEIFCWEPVVKVAAEIFASVTRAGWREASLSEVKVSRHFEDDFIGCSHRFYRTCVESRTNG